MRTATGITLCHSDQINGWHRHRGMLPSGRLRNRQCRCPCRRTQTDLSTQTPAVTSGISQNSSKDFKAGGFVRDGQVQEQRSQHQNREESAPAAAGTLKSQATAVFCVNLAVTASEVHLRSFCCLCCDV